MNNDTLKTAHTNMMNRIDSTTRENHLNAIRKFFELAEPHPYETQVSLEGRMKIEETNESLKAFCKEICTEAINRDFVTYIATGNKGKVGQEVYASLLR